MTLVCPECRHENESERVYCHNCGARLDRSSLAKEKATASEDSAETQKRLRRLLNPQGARIRQNVFQLCKLIIGACAAAVLIEMILPPDLPPRPKDSGLSTQIGIDLETATIDHRGAKLSYSAEQVNGYLATTLKRKKDALDKPLLQFKRAIAGFDEGIFRLTAERSLFGYSLYTSANYRVVVQNGKVFAVNCGGSIGRLPIHPDIMQYGDVVLGDIWQALEQERKQLAKLAAIEFHPQTVVLTAPTQ
jgi:hypothetical protein